MTATNVQVRKPATDPVTQGSDVNAIDGRILTHDRATKRPRATPTVVTGQH